jgi:hypothetical protein
MSQYTSYDTVGEKEDVSDIISNISPTKTPFTTMTSKETVHNTTFEWQEDSLRDVAANAQVEGFTASAAARTPTTLVNNVTQILEDTYEVSNTADAVSHYGRRTESGYEGAKAAQALKLDLEHAFVGTEQTKVSPANNLTARVFAGVQAQIHSDMIELMGSDTPMTEAKFLDAMEAAYGEGAEPTVAMVTPKRTRTIADYATASGRERDFGSSKKLVNVVDVMVTPFGEVKVVINRLLHDDWNLILDPDMWKRVVLKGRDWARTKLAVTGDRTAYMIVGEFSLKHKNQRGSAAVHESA